jgi:aminoglycoside phosphotransferase
MSVAAAPGTHVGRAAALLNQPGARGVLMSPPAHRDATLTFLALDDREPRARLAVKVAATAPAAAALEREGRMLVALRRMQLGALAGTIPRYVESPRVDGRTVLVSSCVPGSPMNVGYHEWLHTARPSLVRADFRAAYAWLHDFQDATACRPTAHTWSSEVTEALRKRWRGHCALRAALVQLAPADRELSCALAPRTAVHGDYCFSNLLVTGGRVSGVVEWEYGEVAGSPLRDLARFPLSYAFCLDQQTRIGRGVRGPRLARPGARASSALTGEGWLPRLLRSFLTEGLRDLGLAPALWYAVALTGIAEVAAHDTNDAVASAHLELLARLPAPAGC